MPLRSENVPEAGCIPIPLLTAGIQFYHLFSGWPSISITLQKVKIQMVQQIHQQSSWSGVSGWFAFLQVSRCYWVSVPLGVYCTGGTSTCSTMYVILLSIPWYTWASILHFQTYFSVQVRVMTEKMMPQLSCLVLCASRNWKLKVYTREVRTLVQCGDCESLKAHRGSREDFTEEHRAWVTRRNLAVRKK